MTTKPPTPLDQLRMMGLPIEFEKAGFPHMASILPPFDSETVKVEHYEMTPAGAIGLAARAFQRENVRDYTPPGIYTRMLVKLDESDPDYNEETGGWTCMMSDTLTERVETRQLLNAAQGHVLVAGLGLGMLVHALLERPDIHSVTVLELNPFVIQAVAPTLAKYGKAVRVIQADARTWEPPAGDNPFSWEFDTVLLDIWPVIGDTMHAELRTMRAHYEDLFPDAQVEGWLERELNLVQDLWELVEAACAEATANAAQFDIRRALGLFSARFHDALEQAQVARLLGRRA